MEEDDEQLSQVWEQLSNLERQFADCELDSFRRKEFALKPLYEKRTALTDQIPDFWPQVFSNPPEEVQHCLTDPDLAILASLKRLCIERYQIQSETYGDPRGLRFIFEFNKNEFFHDTKLVKEFQHQSGDQGSEGLVSLPVPIKWKGKKLDVTGGALGAAVELYQAEETLRSEKEDMRVDRAEQESLWQYQKLREALDDLSSDGPSFFSWFGYRGAIAETADTAKETTAHDREIEEHSSHDEYEDEDNGHGFEIFPGGDEVAIALAEDLWPNVMDYFMAAEMDSEDGLEEVDGDSSDSEAPDLIPKEDDSIEESKTVSRPEKRQRTE